MSERQYAFVEVVGRAGGMNQSGWEGAIPDNECTMIYNMGTSIDGEWKKRKGYDLKKQFIVTASAEVEKLHWHTDEDTDQTDATTWCESGDEKTSASSGALNVTAIYSGPAEAFDGETVGSLYTRDEFGAIGIKSSFNLVATAGKMTFWFKTSLVFGGDLPPGAVVPNYSSNEYPPDKTVYLFYGGANFHVAINAAGDMYWKYGSGATEYINCGPYTYEEYHKIDLRWDNDTGGTIYPVRYQVRIDGDSKGTNDTGPVTNTFATDVFFLNSAADGTDSPGHYATDVYGESHGNYTSGGYSVKTYVSLIKSLDSSSALPAEPTITGIHNNSSQQRAIITAGAVGKVFYSPSWTLATGTHAIANVRTSAIECQGNIYIVDGTTTMFYLVGAATAVSSYTLPETAKWIEEYHGHLCIAGLGTNGVHSVRLSTIDDFVTSSPASWPSTNQIFKCRDVVRGIKAYNGNLIVGTRSTIEAIGGYLPQDFTKTIISAGASCASHWSMVEVPIMDGTSSGLIWAGYDGIYMLVQGRVSKISWKIQDFWDTLSMVEIEESHAVDCRTRGEYMLAVSDGAVAENNYVIVYNYRTGAWDIRRYSARMDVLGKYYRSGKEVILGGDTSGNLYELNITDADNGRAIEGYIQTKWFDGGLPDQDKDFRRLYVWVEPTGQYEVEVGWSTDYENSVSNESVVIGTDGSDYSCILSHEPSVVVGTDGNDYYCKDAHTAAAGNRPTTGASYASFWTATGTIGRGTGWTSGLLYQATDDMKPITGGQYLSYWVPRNTIGRGSVWDASAGYSSAKVQMQNSRYVSMNQGGTKFGQALFGVDVFSGSTSTEIYGIDLTNARGRAIRFLFRTKNANEPFSIRGFKAWFTYVPEFPA